MNSKRWGVWLWVLVCMMSSCVAPPVSSWKETFDAPGDWKLSSDAIAEVTIQDGQLYIHVFWEGQVAWASAGRALKDARVRVEATQISGPVDNEYGILLRMDDDEHFYAFSVSGDGYARVARYDEGVWTVLGSDWSIYEAVQQGAATNLLEVEARGEQLSFRVNDQVVAEVTDDQLARGDVGLYAGASLSEGDVVIAFDNLEVETLP
ncbi:MAG: hypothetical protein JXA33_16065 [Anaerolineae bacterium]|nr:hypothetical protein [Anaerolineae bacterium]